MKSHEVTLHGTASEKDAQKISEEGFTAAEGRPVISENLIYAFAWAEETHGLYNGRRSEVEEGERGKILVFSANNKFEVAYGKDTGIKIDEDNKVIKGSPSRYTSGRNQLGFFSKNPINAPKQPFTPEEVAEGKESRGMITLPPENITMSIEATEELGEVLHALKADIRNLRPVDIPLYVQTLSGLIRDNKNNYISATLDLESTLSKLIQSTIEAEAVSWVRGLSMDVARVKGFDVYRGMSDNVEELTSIEKNVDPNDLKKRIERLDKKVSAEDFDIGIESVNRYLKRYIKQIKEELEKE